MQINTKYDIYIINTNVKKEYKMSQNFTTEDSTSNNSTKLTDNEMTFKFIHLYLDEWKYRYTQFQFLFIKISVIVYTLILFPYIPDVFGINMNNYKLPIVVFPIVGILELALLISQNARLVTISRKINDLTKTIETAYQKYDYNILSKNNKTSLKIRFYKIRLGGLVAVVNFALQIAAGIFIIYALIIIEHEVTIPFLPF